MNEHTMYLVCDNAEHDRQLWAYRPDVADNLVKIPRLHCGSCSAEPRQVSKAEYHEMMSA